MALYQRELRGLLTRILRNDGSAAVDERCAIDTHEPGSCQATHRSDARNQVDA
jgi:hypothetical protein